LDYTQHQNAPRNNQSTT